MSNYMPSTNSTLSTSKRTACDRCRGQKLRCPPQDNESDPCSRCMRQGAQCVKSHSRSMSRPKSLTGMHTAWQPPLMPKTRNPPSTTAGTSESPTATAAHETKFALSQAGISVTDADSLSLSTSDMMFLDSISHDGIGNQRATAFSDFQFQTSDSTYDSTTFDNRNNGLLYLGTGYLDQQMSPPLIESDHQVSEFCLKLARRLQQCQSPLKRNDDNSEIAGGTKFEEDDMGKQESNLFGRILSDTSEFLALVRAYTSNDYNEFTDLRLRSKGYNSTKNKFGTSLGSRPGLVIILNLISAYLQLVLIYKELFSCLSNKLFNEYTKTAFDLQIFPELQLAGFSVEQGNLQVKIFIQTTIHQFEMIEKALGLPPNLRVTDRQDVYLGLLEDVTAKTILEAISGDKLYSESSGDRPGLRILESLREHIKRIWTLSEA